MFRYLKKIVKFYMFYIQPLIGCYLVFCGLWGLYSPDLQECSTKDFCSLSDIITKPSLYIIFGTIIVSSWFFTEVKSRNEEENKRVKSGVKPEDFVK